MVHRWGAILGIALMGAQSVAAQNVGLTEPTARFAESYSFIQTVRELPDGRVMWADPLGQALVIGDLDAATADTLGRVGQGPQEYRQPDSVWPLPGGSTLMVDLGNGRLTKIGPDGTFGDTRPIAQGDPGPGMTIALPSAVDSEGNIYITGRAMPTRGGQLPDSGAVTRLDHATMSVDTVTMIKLPGRTMSRSGGAGNQSVSIQVIPLSPADGWTAAPDGRIGVARSGDYHFEWIGTDGSVVAGAPVDYDPVRIGQAEKEEWDRDRARSGGGLSISMMMNNGVAQASFGRGGSNGDDDLDQYEWPDRKPGFYGNGLLVDPAGNAWVRRHLEAGEQPMYDVFDAHAGHVGSVTLPANRRLVGFGEGNLYAVYMDNFDLNYLERFELPSF